MLTLAPFPLCCSFGCDVGLTLLGPKLGEGPDHATSLMAISELAGEKLSCSMERATSA